MKHILFFTLFSLSLAFAQTDSLSQDIIFGIFVRQVVFRVNPADVMKWEEAAKKIVAAAVKSEPELLSNKYKKVLSQVLLMNRSIKKIV